MAVAGDGKCPDFYSVLGVDKECTTQEMRNAYKCLALKWHPDRCSGNARSVEEAKKKFQGIQEAYSVVLSDSNKRFAYDIGMYQNDDADDNDDINLASSTSTSCSSSNSITFSSPLFKNYSGNHSNSRRKRRSADYAHDTVKTSNTQSQNLHYISGNASSSSSCNSRNIKRRNSGPNYH